MKISITSVVPTLWLLLVVVLVSNGLVVSAVDDESAWKEFKITFNKTYTDEAEELLRKNIFIDNKQFVESHNKRDGQISFTQELNDLSDLTTEEVVKTRCGFRLDLEQESSRRPLDGLLEALLLHLNASTTHHDFVNSTLEKAWYESIFTPQKLDYRLDGRVSKVKNQGACGSCWAFATVGALESYLANREGREILLSEQNLVDCSRGYGNYGCDGGLMDLALRYIKDHGIMANRDYPYEAKESACKFDKDLVITKVRGSAILPRGNESLLRLALALGGPLPVAIDASARSFISYKSGIYDDTVCKNGARSLNHAVLLVGYGTDRAAGDYWILKNSWGVGWGDKGYIRLARNRQNLCGVATYAVLPIF